MLVVPAAARSPLTPGFQVGDWSNPRANSLTIHTRMTHTHANTYAHPCTVARECRHNPRGAWRASYTNTHKRVHAQVVHQQKKVEAPHVRVTFCLPRARNTNIPESVPKPQFPALPCKHAHSLHTTHDTYTRTTEATQVISLSLSLSLASLPPSLPISLSVAISTPPLNLSHTIAISLSLSVFVSVSISISRTPRYCNLDLSDTHTHIHTHTHTPTHTHTLCNSEIRGEPKVKLPCRAPVDGGAGNITPQDAPEITTCQPRDPLP